VNPWHPVTEPPPLGRPVLMKARCGVRNVMVYRPRGNGAATPGWWNDGWVPETSGHYPQWWTELPQDPVTP
jgi:hypothetical protein